MFRLSPAAPDPFPAFQALPQPGAAGVVVTHRQDPAFHPVDPPHPLGLTLGLQRPFPIPTADTQSCSRRTKPMECLQLSCTFSSLCTAETANPFLTHCTGASQQLRPKHVHRDVPAPRAAHSCQAATLHRTTALYFFLNTIRQPQHHKTQWKQLRSKCFHCPKATQTPVLVPVWNTSEQIQLYQTGTEHNCSR